MKCEELDQTLEFSSEHHPELHKGGDVASESNDDNQKERFRAFD